MLELRNKGLVAVMAVILIVLGFMFERTSLERAKVVERAQVSVEQMHRAQVAHLKTQAVKWQRLYVAQTGPDSAPNTPSTPPQPPPREEVAQINEYVAERDRAQEEARINTVMNDPIARAANERDARLRYKQYLERRGWWERGVPTLR